MLFNNADKVAAGYKRTTAHSDTPELALQFRYVRTL